MVKGLELLEAFHVPRVSIETDCAGVVSGVMSQHMASSPLGHYFSEIKRRMGGMEFANLLHTKRDANIPAHALARLGCVAEESCVWFAEVPPSVSSAVAADLPS